MNYDRNKGPDSLTANLKRGIVRETYDRKYSFPEIGL